MKVSKILCIFFLLIIAAADIYPATLHRFHTTLTRIDYNAEGKIFEISIKLFTHDLAPLLERRSGKKLTSKNLLTRTN